MRFHNNTFILKIFFLFLIIPTPLHSQPTPGGSPSVFSGLPPDSIATRANTNRSGIQVSQLIQNCSGGAELPAIIVSGQQCKFSFRPPFGWRVQSDVAQSSVRLVHPATASLIIIRLVEGTDKTPTSDVIRAKVLRESSNSRVLEEFTISALGGTAPALDFDFRNLNGESQRGRAAAVPFPEGHLACHLLTSSREFDSNAHAFHQLLLSLRYASQHEEIKLQPAVVE